jgi:hypothetical protein
LGDRDETDVIETVELAVPDKLSAFPNISTGGFRVNK